LNTSTYIAVLLLACLSIFTTLVGVVLAIYISRKKRWIAIGIGFSVGIMLLISLFELLPQSLALAQPFDVIVALILGGLLIAALHFLIPHTHLFKEEGVIRSQLIRTVYLTAFGLILHDFPEGFAMANAYISSPSVGVAVAIAIALHNIPEEFAMAVPAASIQRRAFLFRAAVVSAMAEPAGAIIGLVAASFNPDLVPLFMAFSAGAMIFVSLHELVPMARYYGRLHLFGIGMLVSIVVYLLLALLLPE
jgi:ZIP family zinc transporter